MQGPSMAKRRKQAKATDCSNAGGLAKSVNAGMRGGSAARRPGAKALQGRGVGADAQRAWPITLMFKALSNPRQAR